MIVLGLDTTGPQCAVSLVSRARVLAHRSDNIGRGHAERLGVMVEEVLTEGRAQPDRLAVCTGPGSFTGVRVALSFARGFALPKGLPIIGLDVTALAYAQSDPTAQARIAVRVDVRRGQSCWAGYDRGAKIIAPRVMDDAEADAAIASFAPDQIISDPVIDTRILAWCAMDCDPDTHLAKPFYARPPDAKLPGGKSL